MWEIVNSPISAGLPNVTGAVDTVANGIAYYGTAGTTGALSTNNAVSNAAHSYDLKFAHTQGVKLDASQASSVYSDEVTTVIPESYCCVMCLKY